MILIYGEPIAPFFWSRSQVLAVVPQPWPPFWVQSGVRFESVHCSSFPRRLFSIWALFGSRRKNVFFAVVRVLLSLEWLTTTTISRRYRVWKTLDSCLQRFIGCLCWLHDISSQWITWKWFWWFYYIISGSRGNGEVKQGWSDTRSKLESDKQLLSDKLGKNDGYQPVREFRHLRRFTRFLHSLLVPPPPN